MHIKRFSDQNFMEEHAPRPPRLCSPQIVCRARTVRSAQTVRRAQIVRCTETEPPSTMMLSHFSGGNPGVGRRNEACRHKWLFLGALNGHFIIFTLQIFCFCRHMWRCGDHLPTCVTVLRGTHWVP